ncbi:MAG: redoxin domain-containing protein [Thermomicrobiales bacterium]
MGIMRKLEALHYRFVKNRGGAMKIGDEAPVFSLPGTSTPGLDLAAVRGKQRVALFFYPKDRTPG